MQSVPIAATTIGDLVDGAAAESDGDAVVFPGERVTFPELAALTDRFARSLRGLGIGPGDKVGILMPNQLDFVVALVGASKLGAVPVPINGRFKEHELSHVIAHADIRVLLTATGPEPTVDYPALVAGVFPDAAEQSPGSLRLETAPLLRSLVHLNGERPGFLNRDAFEAAAEHVSDADVRLLQSRVRVRDIAMLMYTSGTTAKPKGCLLTHEALVRHGANVQRSKFLMSSDDRFWDPLPMFHIGGVTPLLGCLGLRAAFVHAGHFDPLVSLHQLQDERCTVAYPAFDLIWLAILDHPRYAEFDLSRLRLVQSITTPERMRDLQRRMPWAKFVTSLRRHGMREQPDARRSRRRRADTHRHPRHARAGHGAEGRRPGDRRGAAAGPGRRALPARLRDVRGLLQGPRADRAHGRRGGLVPHRRPRLARRGRAVSATPDG